MEYITFIYTLIAVIIISFISLIGAITISIKKKTMHKFLLIIVAFAAGAMLAAAFFDLLPEAIHETGEHGVGYALFGLVLFFLIERYIHWHHCNKVECHVHPVAYLNLIGDSVHNFVDGLIIAAAFMTEIHLGVITTVAIALHEIPQEIGDFAVLIHSGLNTKKALFYNFLSSLSAVIGAVLGYIFLSSIEGITPYLIAVAAGGFIYISTADLLPELHKECERNRIYLQTIALLVGIGLIYVLVNLFSHAH